jgi:hypothetical protein
MKHIMYKTVKSSELDTPRSVGEVLQSAFLASNGNFCMSIIDGVLSITIAGKFFYQGEIEK